MKHFLNKLLVIVMLFTAAIPSQAGVGNVAESTEYSNGVLLYNEGGGEQVVVPNRSSEDWQLPVLEGAFE